MKNPITGQLSPIVRGNGFRAQLVRAAMGVGGLKLLSLPLTLAASILLARGLGPEDYGTYAFIMAVISLFALPIDRGLGQLVTREVAKYHDGQEWALFRGLLRRAHQWIFAGSALIGLTIIGVAATQAEWRPDDRWTVLLIASLALPLLGLNALRRDTLRGLRHVFHAQLPELVVRPGLHLLVAGILVLAGVLNPATALISQIAAVAGAFMLGAWFLCRLSPVSIDLSDLEYRNNEWARALLPFTLLAGITTSNTELGILALGWLGTEADVAALRVAQRGAMLVAMSLAIVNLVIAPHITQAFQNDDRARLQQLCRQSARIALAVALPIGIPLIFMGDPILDLVFGEAYSAAATYPLAILASGQLVNVAFGSVGLFLNMSGFERDTLSGQISALAVHIVAALALIPPFGVHGAAVAVAVSLIVWNSVLVARVIKRLKIRPTAF